MFPGTRGYNAIIWEMAFQIALRNCSKEVGVRSVTNDFSEGGCLQPSTILAEPCYWSGGTDVTVNDFSALLEERHG